MRRFLGGTVEFADPLSSSGSGPGHSGPKSRSSRPMTSTIHRTATPPATPPATPTTVPAASTRTRSLWKAGAGAGLVAAAATVAVAAAAHSLGVKLETAPGQAIPILGFGQLTLFFTAVG